eukprot:Pgem_evm1s11630
MTMLVLTLTSTILCITLTILSITLPFTLVNSAVIDSKENLTTPLGLSMEQTSEHSALNEKFLIPSPSNHSFSSSSITNDNKHLPLLYKAVTLASAAYCSTQRFVPISLFPNIIKPGKIKSEENEFKITYVKGDYNMFGFVAVNELTQEIWLVFRGTQMRSIKNWIKNLDIIMVNPKYEGFPEVKVHS